MYQVTPPGYLQPDCAITLREGLAEYHRANPGLLKPGDMPERAAELFRQHDAGHVVFGCDTSLRGETLIDMWTICATTAGVRGYVEYFEYPQVNELFAATGYVRLTLEFVRCMPAVMQLLWRSLRMPRRWPWDDFERYLDRPLADIRAEFNIRPV